MARWMTRGVAQRRQQRADILAIAASGDVRAMSSYIKRHKLAKKFIVRSSNSLDKQLINEGFSIWQQMCTEGEFAHP